MFWNPELTQWVPVKESIYSFIYLTYTDHSLCARHSMPWRKTGEIVILCGSLVFADVEITSIGKGSSHASCKYEKPHEQGVHGNIGTYRKNVPSLMGERLNGQSKFEKKMHYLEPQIVHINYEGGSWVGRCRLKSNSATSLLNNFYLDMLWCFH